MLSAEIQRALQAVDARYSAALVSLTGRQVVVMQAIAAAARPPTQTHIVEVTGIDRSTLADIVRRLVERGLVQRKHTARDRRAYDLRITGPGSRALTAALDRIAVIDKELDAIQGMTALRRTLAELSKPVAA